MSLITNIKNRLMQREGAKDVVTLMVGTTIAQAIPVAISPILTRLYTPDDFGVFALYSAIVLILSIVVTGRYELAIMLPEKDEDAVNITFLAILINLVVTAALVVIIFLFDNQIAELLKKPEIKGWLLFIPISVFSIGIYQAFNYWSNRKKKYKRLAISRVMQSGIASGTNLAIGFGKFGINGLVLGTIVGSIMAAGVLVKQVWRDDKDKFGYITKTHHRAMAKRYIDFPKYLVVAHTMNTGSYQLPMLLLTAFFNSSIVGFYSLAQRTLGLPITIIATAFGDVFRQKASVSFNEIGSCREIYLKTLRNLVLVSILPFTVFFFISPDLFAFVFSEEWRVAGEYAQIMTIALFLQFIANPLSNMFIIAERQKADLTWQTVLLFSTVLSLILGKYIFDDAFVAIYLSTGAFSIMYIVSLMMSYQFSKGKIKNEREN